MATRVRAAHSPASAADIRSIQEAISPARLSTYLRATRFHALRALALYERNIQIGAALFPCLQVNEVALRNAINSALVKRFGPHWPYAPAFLRALPTQQRNDFVRERTSLERTLRVPQAATGDVVAKQTYWFWVFMLTRRFEVPLWSAEFRRSFPHAPRAVTRDLVHDQAELLRKVRNRIAHHEPLLKHDPEAIHKRAMRMVRWISPSKAEWALARWSAPPRWD